MNEYGLYHGRHYTTYVERVRDLLLTGRFDTAEQLLLALLDTVEAESIALRIPLAPWYYKQLRRIYRFRGDLDAEVGIIERHDRQPHHRPQPSFEQRLFEVCRYASA
jgi:hypothetical protein